ncbi:MarR family transcriptional regulator [Pseudomonas extremaustralis]|uniref:MarR family transcriptional regulator n=1 Tax=Pseudomonas frederiksbergensis TaxID=104087 RepID=A0A0B1Z6H5_9PSED|nr:MULTISPECIES: MarR family transcriptional regulator [Pseudomonas]KHK66654.1 MarR family transcriptional regulator [Pseudomonas frederiksbergensis]MBD0702488.1 MarR family transcriptional regulator [Pseudomonas sp. PSB1]MDG2967709.1 MarR family transcriptional regulator [Pseudomonas extremaustralis]MDR8385414.1 MarR family transcriptional regulator [Pseudomonas sp. JL2]
MTTESTLSFVLHDVARLMRKRFERLTRAAGLTRAQWQVLSKLSMHEGIYQKGLADLLEVEPVTLVRLLDKMQARGLIERRNHPTDRRFFLLFLTPSAHPLLQFMRSIGEQTRLEAMADFSPQEYDQLQQYLERMREHLLTACSLPPDEATAG